MIFNDFTVIFGQVLLLAALALVFWVCRRYVIPFFVSQTTAAQRKDIEKWVITAVEAAEEAERSGFIDRAAKYKYACDMLARVGIQMDAETLRGMIDAACWELFNQFRADDIDTEDYTEGR